MLDLKAKLAAAGVVSAKQVEEFDQKEAKAKAAKRNKADERRNAPKNKSSGGSAKRGSGNNKGGGGSAKRGPGNKSTAGSPRRSPGKKKASKTATDAATLKTLNRGEAYVRIRKVVEHSRLDDKEQTIPGVDDQTFNFVTAQGRIGKLYVTTETAKSLSEGKSAISAFMSHHGLSHCVLPKDIALDFAQVFPYWLRHLQGHEAAGQVEPPPEPKPSPEPSASDSDPGEALTVSKDLTTREASLDSTASKSELAAPNPEPKTTDSEPNNEPTCG